MVPRLALLSALLCIPLFPQTEQPLTTPVYSPSLDVRSMDRTIDPCVNFFQYSCGNWIKTNPIPPDRPSWDVYSKLTNENQRLLWGVLQQAADAAHPRSPNEQKIGDYFHACMDEASVEKTGYSPLRPELDAIAALKSKRDIAPLLAREHMSMSSHALFEFGSSQDFANSQQVIAFASDGGLGLPDRDYYVKTDPKSQATREKYLAHVARLFTLIGEDPPTAKRDAATVMSIETALAKAALTRVEKREPHNLFHKMSPAELQALTPDFDWQAHFSALRLATPVVINVTEPKLYGEIEQLLKERGLDEWKVYLRWHLLHGNAAHLSEAFVRENFDFFTHYLQGVEQLQPRWKRCVQLVDRQLGDALGQVYVEKFFSPEAKKQTVEMARQIETEMGSEIRGLPWMSEGTKIQALAKLHTVVNKVGYPDKWRDYSSVEIQRGDYLGNVERATEFESRRDLNKIDKPVDRTEWNMPAPTVNAYYDPQMNDVNFPAGVLQPPLFDLESDAAPNYGDTGGTIGHELTHGFDDEGRQFDAQGNLRDWWTEKDAAEFEKRVNCVRDQYAQYTVIDNIKINSKLTSGEDVADLGGEVLAWLAWKAATRHQHLESIDGLTPEQRFFVGFAQWACGSERPEILRMRAITDPHSPVEDRINGVVENMPEFKQAFSCRLGQPMVKADSCKVW